MMAKATEETNYGHGIRIASMSFAPWPMALASAATILMALERGYEGWWYKLSTIMHTTEEARGRLLVPFLAAQLQRLAPSLTDHNCFIAVQCVIIAATVWLSGKWASLFLPRFGPLLGYGLLPLMLCPTMTYWNFYDVAIIGFWTACLLLLHHRKIPAYLAIFTIATLNHENNLLLVPCAIAYSWGQMKVSRVALLSIIQIGLWWSVRYLVYALVPSGPLFSNRLWENLMFWKFYSGQALIFAGMVLIPWWLLGLMGWKYAPRLLRCSAISLPGLFVVTTLFGRYEEARQFLAFTPTCIGLIACWLRNETYGTLTGALRTSEDLGDGTRLRAAM
jgi:hypothetical protein